MEPVDSIKPKTRAAKKGREAEEPWVRLVWMDRLWHSGGMDAGWMDAGTARQGVFVRYGLVRTKRVSGRVLVSQHHSSLSRSLLCIGFRVITPDATEQGKQGVVAGGGLQQEGGDSDKTRQADKMEHFLFHP